jgi:hypothetical protein
VAGELSVCCLTRGPTVRVAAQLALLRDLAAEIVVAVDTSVDEQLLGPLENVADVLVRYPYAEPVDRPVGWLHSLPTQDWILWVDDDEIPSEALLAELREAVDRVDVTHAYIPRRTLYRDAGTVLDMPPFVPDYQLRLVVNDPRLLWFPGVTHWPIEAVGPRRYLEGPLYHADVLLSPLERREAKARRYERAAPGKRVAGLPMNDAFFLPERRTGLRTASVPDHDRRTLEHLLALRPWPEPLPPHGAARLADRAEIDAHWHGAPLGEELYRARLERAAAVHPFVTGEQRGVQVRVTNDGPHVWPWGTLGRPEVRLSYRWLDRAGAEVTGEQLRTPLPAPLAPGETCLVDVDVIGPERAGAATLVLDLVHEHECWFGCELSLPVEVHPARRVAVVADDEHLAAAAAAAVCELAPALEPVVVSEEPERAARRLGYAAAPDARRYVLEAEAGERPRGRAGVLVHATALVGDAVLLRRGGRARLTAAPGRAFLEALRGTDALLVVGDDTLRGASGAREAWQRSAALLAARSLGLDVVLASGPGNGRPVPPARLARARATVVSAPPGGTVADALPGAVRLLAERLGV